MLGHLTALIAGEHSRLCPAVFSLVLPASPKRASHWSILLSLYNRFSKSFQEGYEILVLPPQGGNPNAQLVRNLSLIPGVPADSVATAVSAQQQSLNSSATVVLCNRRALDSYLLSKEAFFQ